MATNGRAAPVRGNTRPPDLSAYIGSTLDARSAGASPNNAVINTVVALPHAISHQSTCRLRKTGSSGRTLCTCAIVTPSLRRPSTRSDV